MRKKTCVFELNKLKETIKRETTKFIYLVKANEKKLVDELSETETRIKRKMSLNQIEAEITRKLTTSKLSVENNAYNEQQLIQLQRECVEINGQLNELEAQIEVFKENSIIC